MEVINAAVDVVRADGAAANVVTAGDTCEKAITASGDSALIAVSKKIAADSMLIMYSISLPSWKQIIG